MLKPASFYDLLTDHGIEHMLGVPDSLLKYFCFYAYDQGHQFIAANEGAALSVAAGYHMASGKIPMVYLQNSGFGNLMNPLTSLVDKEVYSVPVLIMVGWRGQPGTHDEPQHIKQGRTQKAQLESLNIPYCVLSSDETEAEQQLGVAIEAMRSEAEPYVLLIPPGTFAEYKPENATTEEEYPLKREEVLDVLVSELDKDAVIVSTTGKTSRELFELREKHGQEHHRDFLTVGSMGHASQIALGIALEQPERPVFCIDGDGAVIMHMGSMATIGEQKPANFRHILINNGAHESVGGQPTAGFSVDFCRIAEGCGYKNVYRAKDMQSLKESLGEFLETKGPVLLEIMTKTGARANLGRPTIAPADNKKDLMNFLSKEK